MTVSQLIDAAMTSLGELMPGQTSNPEEYALGMQALNDLLESWRVQHRKIYEIVRLEFALTPGLGVYTMGPGGNFNSFRPDKVEIAGTVRYDGSDPIGLRKDLQLISAADYAAIAEKGAFSKQPLRLYVESGYPLLTLRLWPIPQC